MQDECAPSPLDMTMSSGECASSHALSHSAPTHVRSAHPSMVDRQRHSCPPTLVYGMPDIRRVGDGPMIPPVHSFPLVVRAAHLLHSFRLDFALPVGLSSLVNYFRSRWTTLAFPCTKRVTQLLSSSANSSVINVASIARSVYDALSNSGINYTTARHARSRNQASQARRRCSSADQACAQNGQ